MNYKRYGLMILPLLTILLELLPWGAVLNFAQPDGVAIQHTYSYFDPTPYGYANFGPFLTALLTCVLLLLTLVYLFHCRAGWRRAIVVVSAIALGTSLLPLTLGLSCYSVTGGIISLLLLLELILTLRIKE